MSVKIIFSIIFAAILCMPAARAEIVVPAGHYESGALLRPVANSKQIEAVFNFKSRSECRVRLTGSRALALSMKRPVGRWIRFDVKTDARCGVVEAELLAVEELKGREIPLRVGNGFKHEK